MSTGLRILVTGFMAALLWNVVQSPSPISYTSLGQDWPDWLGSTMELFLIPPSAYADFDSSAPAQRFLEPTDGSAHLSSFSERFWLYGRPLIPIGSLVLLTVASLRVILKRNLR